MDALEQNEDTGRTMSTGDELKIEKKKKKYVDEKARFRHLK